MDIYATPGTKIVFTGKNGTNSEQEQARLVLEVGKTYTLAYAEIGSWRTEIFLEEVSGGFNSVMFLEEELYRQS